MDTNKNQPRLSSRSTHPGSSINSNAWMPEHIRHGTQRNRKSFTLIELLVVLALVAILSVVVILTLNPAELLKQARDSNRLSDLATINTALNLFSTDVTSGFMGTSTIVYVSLPSTTSTCSNLGLPTLPTGYTYNCVTSANLRNTDGTGWIPVNFNRISSNSPISQLPIDPQNTTSTGNYYAYVTGGSWAMSSMLESQKYLRSSAVEDGGYSSVRFEVGNDLNLIRDSEGLVLWLPLDDGAGTVAMDKSNSGNNFRFQGSPQWLSSGKIGGALSFTVSNYISITRPTNNSLEFPGNLTFSFWYKTTSTLSDNYWMLSKGSPSGGCVGSGNVGYDLYLRATGTAIRWLDLCGPVGTATYSSKNLSNLNDGNWHHVVSERDGNTTRFYFDGVFQDASSFFGDVTGTSNVSVGGPNFIGQMDDVRFYKRALSASEILTLYNSFR